jgi:hypothetical protein
MKVKEKFNKLMDYRTIFKDSSKLYGGLCLCYIIICTVMIIDMSLYEDTKKWKTITVLLVYLIIIILYGMLSRIMNEV